LMLRHSFELHNEAAAIEQAVHKTLQAGYRTRDIYTEGTKLVGTEEMANKIMEHIL
jgi:3-isopropylmalate dehydrogenase